MEFTIDRLAVELKYFFPLFNFYETPFSVLDAFLKVSFVARFVCVIYLTVSVKFVMFEVSRVVKAVFSLKSAFARFLSILQRPLVNSSVIESDNSKDKFTVSEQPFFNSLTVGKSSHTMELIFVHFPFIMISIMILDAGISTLSIGKPSFEKIAFCILDHSFSMLFTVLVNLTCVLWTVIVFDFRLIFAHLNWMNKSL